MFQKKSSHNFNQSIIRAYDIRGIVGKTLHIEDAYYIGLSFASHLKDKLNGLKVSVGYDGRLSSPELKKALITGLLDAGVDVFEIGICATPTLYYSVFKLETDAGIMVTGSHNPPEYNGFKIMLKGGASFFGEDLIKISNISTRGNFSFSTKGKHHTSNVSDTYIEKLRESALGKCAKELKIAWDPGNGATVEAVNALTSIIPGKHFVINNLVDGNFPAHHPDPTIEENLKQLQAVVIENNCDLGIAFDGDGDRIGVVDNKGRMLFGEQLLLIYAYDLVKRYQNPKVIADVKTSDSIFAKLGSIGIEPVMWKTGHSHIKAKMKQEGAVLAGEMSGHIFFGENYYYFDDALFGACKLINILSNTTSSLDEIINSFPKTFSTPELRVEVPEEIKFLIVEELVNLVKKSKINANLLDGIRASDEIGWWLIRASNTQNCLVVRIESESDSNLKLLQEKFKSLVAQSRYSKVIIPQLGF